MKINYGIIILVTLLHINIVSGNIIVENADTVWTTSVIPASQDVVYSGEAQPQNISTIFVKDVDTIWTTSVIPASQDVIDSGEAQPQNISTIFLKDVDTIWNTSLIPASQDVIDPGETQPQDISAFFVKDADTIWNRDLLEATDIIPSTTEIVMNETASTAKNLFETVISSELSLNTSVTGDMNGTFNFTGLENVLISSGSFAGKGFSRGGWYATIEGASYDGSWQGVLFEKLEERRVYIKGTIEGGLKGIVEGYLTESVNGSGIYDQYNASWTISQMGIYTVYSRLDARGTINYGAENEYSSELYALQTLIEGKASGYYNRSLSVVLTHIRIDNVTNPYSGQGFSFISYVSEYGPGEGWTYDKTISSGLMEFKGLFTEPLRGITSGFLEDNGISRSLKISIERIDYGLEPIASPTVKVWGPASVSPGQTIDYITEYRNHGLKQANDFVVVTQLPYGIDYVSSSNDGIYYAKKHQVFWRLGSVGAKDSDTLSVKVNYPWGLQSGKKYELYSFSGTSSPTSSSSCTPNIKEYAEYDSIRIINAEVLPTQKLNEEIKIELSDQNIKELFGYANDLGFNHAKTMIRLAFNDGSRISYIMVMNKSDINDPPVFITKINKRTGTASFLMRFLNDSILFFNSTGGMYYNIINSTYIGWGSWNASENQPGLGLSQNQFIINGGETMDSSGGPTYSRCLKNGLIENTPIIMISFGLDVASSGWAKVAGQILSLPDYIGCTKKFFNEWELTTDCANSLTNGIKSSSFVGPIVSFFSIFVECLDPQEYDCTGKPPQKKCSKDNWISKYTDYPEGLITLTCVDGVWEETGKTICDMDPFYGGPCQDGKGKCIGGDCKCNPSSQTTNIAAAHDPNIKYGPNGFIRPDQKLNYTVEFENEGEGIAFGVYFTDTLDKDLDDSTLEIGPVMSIQNGSIIAPPGVYDQGTRTITWFVGEVGSREGGYSNYSIKPRSDPEEGTEIINYATVYFPSVPETTRTNGIVSIIDVTSPGFNNVNQSRSNATVGDFVEVSAFWKDGVQLNQAWLETNESGTWSNVSHLNLSGTQMWSNFSILTKNEGTICWQIHANDKAGNENATHVLCFDVLQDKVPPVASCSPDNLNCQNVGTPVQFNGSASYDPDGNVSSYYWDFGDDTNGTGAAPEHIYASYKWNGTAYGSYIVNLTVTDDSGLTNRTSQMVIIWAAGDANGDGNVNILDASVVGLKWGSSDPCPDLNNDGTVNILDASIIGLNWGKSAQIKT